MGAAPREALSAWPSCEGFHGGVTWPRLEKYCLYDPPRPPDTPAGETWAPHPHRPRLEKRWRGVPALRSPVPPLLPPP